MTVFLIIAAIVCAYLLGSIPSAYFITKMRKGTDIRQIGSKNMGAMNVYYNVGFVWGLLVMAMDIGKGTAAIAIADAMGVPELAQMGAGLVAVLGHNFPVFLNFRGGKGGATVIGVLIYLMPWGIPLGLGIFGLLLLVIHFPTLSYGIAMLNFPFIAWLIYDRWEWVVFSMVMILVPYIRYIPRIKEMKAKAGNWQRVIKRQNIKDRF